MQWKRITAVAATVMLAAVACGSPSSNSNAQLASLNQTNVGFDNDTAALIGSAVGLFQMA